MEQFNKYVTLYKEALAQGDIQKAYAGLVKYMLGLKIYLSKSFSTKYSFGNTSQGYMDYTYFPFVNDFLRENKLRFGVVLNHEKVSFELWLMGQNAEIQNRYWSLLKHTKWNKNRVMMPRYAVLEVVLIAHPDFNDLDDLNQKIEVALTPLVEEITNYIQQHCV